jgi:hypothetical protein
VPHEEQRATGPWRLAANASAMASSPIEPEPSSSAPLRTESLRAGRVRRRLSSAARTRGQSASVACFSPSSAPPGRTTPLKARSESWSTGVAESPTWSRCAPNATSARAAPGPRRAAWRPRCSRVRARHAGGRRRGWCRAWRRAPERRPGRTSVRLMRGPSTNSAGMGVLSADCTVSVPRRSCAATAGGGSKVRAPRSPPPGRAAARELLDRAEGGIGPQRETTTRPATASRSARRCPSRRTPRPRRSPAHPRTEIDDGKVAPRLERGVADGGAWRRRARRGARTAPSGNSRRSRRPARARRASPGRQVLGGPPAALGAASRPCMESCANAVRRRSRAAGDERPRSRAGRGPGSVRVAGAPAHAASAERDAERGRGSRGRHGRERSRRAARIEDAARRLRRT